MAGPRRLNLSNVDQPQKNGPRRIGLSANAPEKLSIVDELINKAKSADSSLDPMRIKGRIQTLLPYSTIDILDWGERNLAPLRDASTKKTNILNEMNRINAFGWLEEAKNASCKTPSFLDRFTAKPPHFYEAVLAKCRGEMMVFVASLENMKKSFEREVKDLHLDALALTVCCDQYSDLNTKQCAVERAKTLRLAHQTAAMLFTTIEQTMQQCSNAVQQIDSFVSVTLPNWKMMI